MSDILTVDGLPQSFTDENLKELFASYGQVLNATIIYPQHIPSCRYGFVEMATVEEADHARQALNRTMIDHQLVLVFRSRSECSTHGSPTYLDGGAALRE